MSFKKAYNSTTSLLRRMYINTRKHTISKEVVSLVSEITNDDKYEYVYTVNDRRIWNVEAFEATQIHSTEDGVHNSVSFNLSYTWSEMTIKTATKVLSEEGVFFSENKTTHNLTREEGKWVQISLLEFLYQYLGYYVSSVEDESKKEMKERIYQFLDA